MFTKEYIQNIKNSSANGISNFIKNYTDSRSLIFILENLGELSENFDASFLPQLLNHKNVSVRFWTVKTFGKLHQDEYLMKLKEIASHDPDSLVRREAVSSIGRMKNQKAKNILIEFLCDKDPKIVNQAIRGLLIFKGEPKIDQCLKILINHDDEMIRTVIDREYYTDDKEYSIQKHAESYDYLKNIIVNADNIETMKCLQDESIHLTFTSPPYYNARDYSIYSSYKHYLKFLTDVFIEVHRLTKEGRFLILNTSPIIIPRISRSYSSKRYPIPFDIHPYLVDMGWEFIDDIIWLKSEASVKNRIGGFMQHRKPLGYKPNTVTEYLMVYRKMTDKLIDWNIKQYDDQTVMDSKVIDGYEKTNVWKIDPCSDKVHSAVFPIELCKRVIQYYSYQSDLVFDPFSGSGTIAKVAKQLGRFFFLIEKEEKYFKYMQSQILEDMFTEHKTKFLTLDRFKSMIP